MFKKMQSYTHGAKEKNEDYCYICNNFGFVIDGASGLDKVNIIDEISDAAWFSHFIGDELKALLLTEIDILNALTLATEKAKSYYYSIAQDRKILPHQLPSASIAIFRIANNVLEYLQLGDCSGAILQKNGSVKLILEEKFPLIDAEAITLAVNISKTKNITIKEAMTTQEISEKLISNRQKKNQPNGYFILDISGDGVPYANVQKFTLGDIKAILCCSDGFAQIVTGYGICKSYDELIVTLPDTSLEALAKILYAHQNNDSDFAINPRFKHSDDTSAVYAELA